MSQRRIRLQQFGNKAQPLITYVYAYQYALKALIATVAPPLEVQADRRFVVAVGRNDIWPCKDGGVVITSVNSGNNIEVITHDPLNKTIKQFFEEYDFTSSVVAGEMKGYTAKYNLQIPAIQSGIFWLTGVRISPAQGIRGSASEFVPQEEQIMILPDWSTPLPKPDEQALISFRYAFFTKNIVGEEIKECPFSNRDELIQARAKKLIDEFKVLLNTAQKEEDLQRFLRDHPEFLYPDYMQSWPKLPLGEKFVTDYVLLIQGVHGPEYAFVEIERADKIIFTKPSDPNDPDDTGQFTAPFTQALNQIYDWDGWITKNHAYIRDRLPGLHKPKYRLVIGRNSDFTPARVQKLQSAFASTSCDFSTYDDLADRFEKIVFNLLKSSSTA